MAMKTAQTVLTVSELFKSTFFVAERRDRRLLCAYKVRVGGPR